MLGHVWACLGMFGYVWVDSAESAPATGNLGQDYSHLDEAYAAEGGMADSSEESSDDDDGALVLVYLPGAWSPCAISTAPLATCALTFNTLITCAVCTDLCTAAV